MFGKKQLSSQTLFTVPHETSLLNQGAAIYDAAEEQSRMLSGLRKSLVPK
jgi:hypothetical protein